MAILLDEKDPVAQDLVITQQAYKHTVNLLSAADVHVPAGIAEVVIALKAFHQKRFEEATKAIDSYIESQRGEGHFEQSTRSTTTEAVG